jgi:hypothetical protein
MAKWGKMIAITCFLYPILSFSAQLKNRCEPALEKSDRQADAIADIIRDRIGISSFALRDIKSSSDRYETLLALLRVILKIPKIEANASLRSTVIYIVEGDNLPYFTSEEVSETGSESVIVIGRQNLKNPEKFAPILDEAILLVKNR